MMKRFVKLVDADVSDRKRRTGVTIRLAQKSYAPPPHEILSLMAL